MKELFRVLLCSVAAVSALCAADKKPLSNADVLKMLKAELPESTVIVAIENSPRVFDTSPEALIALKEAGVGPKVLEAMLAGRQASSTEGARSPEPPTESEAEEILRALVKSQSEDVISVMAFSKVDGQAAILSAVPVYEMHFSTVIGFREDCIWKNLGLEKRLTFGVARKQKTKTAGAWDEFLHASQNPGLRVARGSSYLIKGVIQFERMESGWKVASIRQEGIEASTAATVAKMQGEKNARTLRTTSTLSRDALVRFMEAKRPASDDAGQPFKSEDGKVTALCPPGFRVEKSVGVVVGKFVPVQGDPVAGHITLTCSSLPRSGRNTTLSDVVTANFNSNRSQYPGVILSETVKSSLAGVDAETFAMTMVENNVVRQKVVTLAICRNHILGVVFHSTPEGFAGSWDAYRRLCDSYVLAAK